MKPPVWLTLVLGAVFLLAGCGPQTTESPTAVELPTQTLAQPAPATQTSLPTQALQPSPATGVTGEATISSVPTLTTEPATPTSAPLVNATALPDPSGYRWEVVISGVPEAVALVDAGDGSGRLFVVQQTGDILIFQNGALLPQPFLDLHDRITQLGSGYSERGLLGLVFHPQFKSNGFFFVNYTDRNGNTVIARFSVSSGSPDQADPNSELQLIHVDQPYANHNGGALAFGPDGYLYIGLGDGGSANDPENRAQSLNTLLGKILRIDVDQGDPYAIPPDNPFAQGGGLPEIWAYGLRNPWRFSFDRSTGDLYIGDVGQNQWEEIDYLPAGSPGGTNFGWRYFEGNHSNVGTPPAGFRWVPPVAEYNHSEGCAVMGGVVYRGVNLPEWQGVYLYGDYCSGRVWGLLKNPDGSWQNAVLYDQGYPSSAFGQDAAGEVFLVGYQAGEIYRLVKK